ncbi:DUF1254 domain-containing protein [Fluviibacterium sp. S390]|uniref:DUF1254 domain-containing protein n=1 Tax=Fluviibacterium sp. S390 TaxID=3415139 RepID=UPI003C7C28EE
MSFLRRYVLPVLASAVLISTTGTVRAQETVPNLRDAARDSYIFTYPLVMMYRTMFLQAIDATSPSFSGGMGVWLHLGVATPADTDIVTPNNDTPYSYAWVDLRSEPWVLTLPAIEAERFYTSQWDDLWGHVLDNAGSVNDGNGGVSVLLAGPDWAGDLPAGIDRVIRDESRFLGTLTRTQLLPDGGMDAVEAIQNGYALRPLSASLDQPAPRPQSRLTGCPGRTARKRGLRTGTTSPVFCRLSRRTLRIAGPTPRSRSSGSCRESRSTVLPLTRKRRPICAPGSTMHARSWPTRRAN